VKIQIDNLAYQKVMYWMRRSAPNEVSGFGVVEVIRGETMEDFTLFVKDAFLLPQKNAAASSDIDAEGLAKLEYRVFQDYGRDAELRWWWHSHVTMSAFWSGIDKRTLEKLSHQGWMSATVFNLDEEQRSCVVSQGELPFFLDEVDFEVVTQVPDDLTAVWDAEFDQNVKVHRATPRRRRPRLPYELATDELASARSNGVAWAEASRSLDRLECGDEVEVRLKGQSYFGIFDKWLSYDPQPGMRWAVVDMVLEERMENLPHDVARYISDDHISEMAIHEKALFLP